MNLTGYAYNLPVRSCVPIWYVVRRILHIVGKILHYFVECSSCKCACFKVTQMLNLYLMIW